MRIPQRNFSYSAICN